ncbi:hypothetical protein RHECNPAF_2330054 [Rhizobium etli CNPAF512]|nr:hypothetical protein RHECNPAF_2330054 [Rhizobium etli CNPAF512]
MLPAGAGSKTGSAECVGAISWARMSSAEWLELPMPASRSWRSRSLPFSSAASSAPASIRPAVISWRFLMRSRLSTALPRRVLMPDWLWAIADWARSSDSLALTFSTSRFICAMRDSVSWIVRSICCWRGSSRSSSSWSRCTSARLLAMRCARPCARSVRPAEIAARALSVSLVSFARFSSSRRMTLLFDAMMPARSDRARRSDCSASRISWSRMRMDWLSAAASAASLMPPRMAVKIFPQVLTLQSPRFSILQSYALHRRHWQPELRLPRRRSRPTSVLTANRTIRTIPHRQSW